MKAELSDKFLEGLRKGDRIPCSVIVQATGLNRHDKDYRLGMMAVQQVVEGHFRKNGQIITTCCKLDTILILTDAQASVVRTRRFRGGRRKMDRSEQGLKGVDTNALTETERREHEERLRIVAFQNTALRRAEKKMDAERKLRDLT